MAKTNTLKPGDQVTLKTDNMARSLLAHCRTVGIVEQVGTVALVNQNRVQVAWAAQQFAGWFDADALTAEVVQPRLGL